MTIEETVSQRFWSKVEQRGPEDCWEWRAFRHPAGYGRFRVGDKQHQAHRVAWFLTHRGMQEKHVLHRCDNPPCCNPGHLFLGTDQDNSDDKVSKGRQTRGTRVHTAKLDEEKVRAILLSRESDVVLATRYGVSVTAISDVRLGVTWSHIPDPHFPITSRPLAGMMKP